MKKRLLTMISAAITGIILSGSAPLAHAQDTNSTSATTKTEKKTFLFNGGGPLDFILAVDKHFRTRLGQILSIPSSLTRAEVPKMKIATDNPHDALQAYNYLQDPMLGQWKYFGPSNDLAVLTLVPDKEIALRKAANANSKVRALALGGVPENKWDQLQQDVEAAQRLGSESADLFGGGKSSGLIQIQRESKLLIVSGSEAFIEMVESVLAAYRSNAQNESQAAGAK